MKKELKLREMLRNLNKRLQNIYGRIRPLVEGIAFKHLRKFLPLILGIILAGVVIGLILTKTQLGRGIMGNATTTIRETAIKLRLNKFPLVKKLFAEKKTPVETKEMPKEAILVKVYKVARKDFEDTLPSLGTVKGYREIDLKFEISGVIDSINFREGDEIREGDIIASLDQYDALLKLKYAKIELDRVKKLFDIGSVTKVKLDQAELEYESAKSDLDKTYLYAPRDGVLGTRDAEVGEYVTSNDKVATLIDNSDVFVEIGVVERDVGKIKVGQDAKIFIDAYPDIEFKGRVNNISPVVEGRTRTQTAKIRVNNDKRLLLPGMFARVLTNIYAKKNAIVIPNTAINKEKEGYIVFVVHRKEEKEAAEKESEEDVGEAEMEGAGEPGIAEARVIVFEYRSSDFSVIKEGLEEGELVVVETQEKLKDNTNVIITEVQEQFL